MFFDQRRNTLDASSKVPLLHGLHPFRLTYSRSRQGASRLARCLFVLFSARPHATGIQNFPAADPHALNYTPFQPDLTADCRRWPTDLLNEDVRQEG